ncbi:MAG: UDP-N-acetylmuramate dehydrogenase [Kiritimatiellia bacterium]
MAEIDPQVFRQAGLSVRRQVPLSTVGSFQLGGPAAFLIECGSPKELAAAHSICADQHISALLLGEGSNLLFSDRGWPGVLVRYVAPFREPEDLGEGIWKFCAGIPLQSLVDWAIEHGQSGLEAFTGIPGTLGGAVVGNAGAWGVQMEHVLLEVHGWNAEGALQCLRTQNCGFAYRDSSLKHQGFWVSEVVLKTTNGDVEALRRERDRILALRAERHPDWRNLPCIGSFFKNLEPTSAAERRQAAGWFLETAGAKEQRVGGAGVFAGHANILVKREPDCTAADVAALARNLQQAVKNKHGLDLVREVRYLGDIPGEKGGSGFY